MPTENQLQDYAAKGALIIDVRTIGEFMGGHVVDSINIPLQEIQQKKRNLSKIAIDIEIVLAILFLIFASLKTKTHTL